VLTPLLGDGTQGRDLPFLSSLCGACYDVCPVKIPLHDMLVDLRADYEATAARGRPRRLLWAGWAGLWRSSGGYRASLAAARLAAPVLRRTWLRRLPGPGREWARVRELPSLAEAGALRRWLARRRRGTGDAGRGTDGR
ncbi:MAG: amino acid dehydrogenase, partial [Actinobacteria bacterium]|nr:amino acid dehydrogenase [Actinomycetota bacterium]